MSDADYLETQILGELREIRSRVIRTETRLVLLAREMGHGHIFEHAARDAHLELNAALDDDEQEKGDE